MVAKENMKVVKVSPELKGHIKDFFKQGMSIKAVSDKLNVPYWTAYYYSPQNKKRLAKAKRLVAKKIPKRIAKDVYANAIESKIAELEAERDAISIKIETLRELV